jgi:hypothetical protein
MSTVMSHDVDRICAIDGGRVMIDWKPIAEMPEALKDGRQVLVWQDGSPIIETGAHICLWFNGWVSNEAYYGEQQIMPDNVTHYAEINAPGAVVYGKPLQHTFFGVPIENMEPELRRRVLESIHDQTLDRELYDDVMSSSAARS